MPFKWFADEEAYFLWHLVNDVNLTILKNAQANRDLCTLAHCALYGLVRQITQPDLSHGLMPVRPITELADRTGQYLYAKFETLFEEALVLAAAIDELSKIYLGADQGILFADSRAVLEAQIANLRKTGETFAPLAVWLNVEPIAAEGFNPGHPMVDAKVAQLAGFSRAESLIQSGNQRRFMDALHRACPELAAS